MSGRKAGAEMGYVGEYLAERFLSQKGFRVRERNYACRCGEIDIIAEERKTLVFVEVKCRSSVGYGQPEESVNFFKRRRLIKTAMTYLKSKGIDDIPCRFDIVSVVVDASLGSVKIKLIRNAFSCG